MTAHLSRSRARPKSGRHFGLPGLALALALVAALALVGAAACGGGDASSSTTGPTGSSEDFAIGGQDDQDAQAEFDELLESGLIDGEPSEATGTDPENPGNLASLNRLGGEPYRPDFKDPSGFINTEPFSLDDLEGRVILIDFWTYTCINCIRTMPFLRDWHEKYAADGLVIVGVHSPEFEFEKIKANVEQAVAEFGLLYPIVQDNDFGTWRNYENRFWPAKYLIDRDGFIRYTHFGEGAYDETELKIRELLAENGGTVSIQDAEFLPTRDLDDAVNSITDQSTSVTRELYAGTERNYSALQFGGGGQPPYVHHEQYYSRQDLAMEYVDPGDHDNHFLYLNGLWTNGPESLLHARTTEGYEDYVAIIFYGTSANIVLGVPDFGESYEVRVTFDGAPIPADHAGEDVMWDDDGNSYLLVTEDRLYRVAKTPQYGGYELKLSSNSDKFEFFAFTFGVFNNAP